MWANGFSHPPGLLAGFIVVHPAAGVPELVMAGQQWGPCSQKIAPHAHEVWEFYYQVSGRTEWRVRGRRVGLDPGTLFAMPPHVKHELIRVEGGDHEYFFAAFDPAPCLARLGMGPFPERRPRWVGGALEAGDAFRGLVRELSLERPLRETGLRLALDALALEVVRWMAHESRPRRLTGGHPTVERAMRLMEQDLARTWRLDLLARLCGVSAGHLGVCFREATGRPPMEWLQERRMERARELLRQGEAPITRIALDLGFSSSQHFAGVFREKNSCTPRDYRKSPVRGQRSSR